MAARQMGKVFAMPPIPPRRRTARLVTLCALAAQAACSRPSRPADAPAASDPGGQQATAGAAAAPPAALGPGSAAPPVALLLSYALVRREPTEARDVAVVGHRRKQPNALATLYRGEQVRVLHNQSDWLQVCLSDEREGWIKAETVLMGKGVRSATVLRPCHSFTRPDLLALHSGRTIEPGTLLFVLRDKEPFSEVNYGGGRTAWVLSAWLVGDAAEIDAAKLVHRARLLQEKRDPGAAAVIDLARGHFSQTRLMQALTVAGAWAPPAVAQSVALEVGEAADGTATAEGAATADLAPQANADGLLLVPQEMVVIGPDRGGAPGLQDRMPPPVAHSRPGTPAVPPAEGLADAPDVAPPHPPAP